jgi:RimJ/RimL family protein N-acetyltransferase
MLTRELRVDDAPVLQQLMRDTPQGTDGIEFSFVNEPDFFARSRAYENASILVAEDGGSLAGSAAFAIRDSLVAGVHRRVAYEFQYFTAFEHRRKGVARQLRARIDDELSTLGAELTTSIVLRENEASIRLFEQHGFRRRAPITLNFMLVEHTDMRLDDGVSTARPEELDEIAALLNETWAGHDFSIPVSGASLAATIERIPTIALERFFVKREGDSIVACAAIWDWTYVQKVLVHRVAPEVATSFPTLRPNSILQQWGITMAGYRSTGALHSLLLHIGNLACHERIDHLALPFESGSELEEAVHGIAAAQLHGDLYVRPVSAQVEPSSRPISLDIIDF